MRFLFVLFAFLLLFFSAIGFSWHIDGDSVIEETDFYSISVSPFLATSPVNNFNQEFVLCNKTAVQRTVFAAYLFDFPLRKGQVFYWQTPVYDWVSHSFVCPGSASFVYVMNKFPGSQNPNWAKCFKTIHDSNGFAPDRNEVYFDKGFKTGSIPTRIVYFDSNELVSGNSWLDVSADFKKDSGTLNGKYFYPYLAGVLFPANSCKKWKINYSPALEDDSKKWDLWLWAGDSWDCLLDNSCHGVLKLDPWWDGDWLYKRPIYLPNQTMTAGETIQIEGIDFSSMSVLANLNDVRVVDENLNVELDRLCDGTNVSTDGNCFFFLDYNFTKNDDDINSTYYLYYGNAAAGNPPDQNVERSNVCNFEYNNCGFNGTMMVNKNVVKFGVQDANTKTNGDMKMFESAYTTTGTWDWNYTAWIRSNDAAQYSIFRIRTAVDHTCFIGVYNDAFMVLYNGNESEAYFGASADDTWYKVIIHYKNGDANCGYQIKDSTGADLMPPFSFSIATTGETAPDRLNIANYPTEQQDPTTTKTTYVSNVFRGMPSKAIGLGIQQSNNAAPNLNFWKAGVYDFNSGLPFFKKDANITITFTVFDAENDRLTVDLNYSISPAQGTGIPFATDLNLTSAFCPNQNWDTGISVCSFDWNAGANDGNYYILAEISDSRITDFNSSVSTIGIDSNAPKVYLWVPLNNSTVYSTAFQFDVNKISGAHVSTITATINGLVSSYFNLAVHCTAFNGGYSCSYDENGTVVGVNTLTIWSVDAAGNVSDLNISIFSYLLPLRHFPVVRYIDPANPYIVDSNRFFESEDPRASSTARFFAGDDLRGQTVASFNSKPLAVPNQPLPLLFYLTIGIIIVVIIVFLYGVKS